MMLVGYGERGTGRGQDNGLEGGATAPVRRWATAAALAAAAALSAGLTASDAAACGGCFTTVVEGQQGEGTQVSGHRMILSVRKDATSLWDQITYVGEPESFAWVLP